MKTLSPTSHMLATFLLQENARGDMHVKSCSMVVVRLWSHYRPALGMATHVAEGLKLVLTRVGPPERGYALWVHPEGRCKCTCCSYKHPSMYAKALMNPLEPWHVAMCKHHPMPGTGGVTRTWAHAMSNPILGDQFSSPSCSRKACIA